jgi:hypothetical protein
MLAKTSPYGGLRLLSAVAFGVGVTLAALTLLGGLAGLIVLSVGGNPVVGVSTFLGALVAAVVIFLVAKIANEMLRLWADVGDRMRQMTQMLEDSLNRPHEETR